MNVFEVIGGGGGSEEKATTLVPVREIVMSGRQSFSEFIDPDSIFKIKTIAQVHVFTGGKISEVKLQQWKFDGI